VADGDLLVCTERCDGATPGYTAEESRQRLRDHVLGQVFADAITYRTPAGDCAACDDTGQTCGDHVADCERAAAYLRLAAGLGITVPR